MRIFTYILTVLAIVLIVYNLTLVNFSSPFEGDSIVAVITVFCGFCALILLALIRLSRRLDDTIKKRK